jgi:hypothetical protein
MPNVFMPEGLIPLVMMPPQLGTTDTYDWINVGRAQKVWIDYYSTIAAATTTTVTPRKAYAAAGTGTAVLGFNVPIWYGTATAAGLALTLTRQTDAANQATSGAAGIHRIIFEIEVSALGIEATVPSLGAYNYISITHDAVIADYTCCTVWVLPRYASDEVASTTWIV